MNSVTAVLENNLPNGEEVVIFYSLCRCILISHYSNLSLFRDLVPCRPHELPLYRLYIIGIANKQPGDIAMFVSGIYMACWCSL